MDRELDSKEIDRRRRRRWAWALGGLALFLTLWLLLPSWLRPTLARERVRFGQVDRGPIEGVVEAQGQVIPAFESLLSSPIEARVEKILKRAGEEVKAGEAILELDTSASRIALERLEDLLRKKANEKLQLRLELEKNLAALRVRKESQKLDLEALEYRAEQNRKLRAQGLVSELVLRASEVEAKKARIELDQLLAQAESEGRSTAARLEGLELDLATLRRDRDEARRQLELATTRSDRAGVLTWVIPREGATLSRGEVLARIADLDCFRVEARVSDVHSAKLRAGEAVRVLLGGEPLSGRLAQVDPTIEKGTLKFTVDLDEPRHAGLRNNLSVDVLVVVDSRPNALRAPKGPYAAGARSEPVFVVEAGHPGRALRRSVRFGLAGYDRLEVLGGLEEGDQVIVSDMRDYLHLSRIDLN